MTGGVNAASAGPRCILVIDLGSGGPKAGVVTEYGEVLASAAERVETIMLPGGGVEQDPIAWWDGSVRAARAAIDKSGVRAERICAVSCDSQFLVAVPLDENGEPLMNAIHWLDRRGGPYNRAITKGFPSIQGYGLKKLLTWIRHTGLAPTHSGVDSMGHMLFVKNERPEIYRKTAAFLEPMDYLVFRLTGKVCATQHTMLPFGVVDNRKWSSLNYCEPLLRYAGIGREKLPQLIANDGIAGTVLPSVAAELGISPSTPVVAGMKDTNCSAIGSGAVHDFEGIVYIGTSLVLTCHVPFKKTDLFHMMFSMPSPLKDKYLLFAEQGVGGRSLEFLLKNIFYSDGEFGSGPIPDDVFERANRAAASVPAGSEGCIFLPWLNGTVVPEEFDHARGGFLNITLSTTRGHLVRSVMEGMAFNSRWARDPAERFIGRKFSDLRFAGGGALSDLWSQIYADVLGVPVRQVADAQNTTIRGAAFAALLTLGMRSLDEIPGLVKIRRTYEPDESKRDLYNGMFLQFREIFKRNKKIFKALNG